MRRINFSRYSNVRRPFNNMSGFLIGALRSRINDFVPSGISTDDYDLMKRLEDCFDDLKVLLESLSSKKGNRMQLRMVFEPVSDKFSKMIRRAAQRSKRELNDVEITYF